MLTLVQWKDIRRVDHVSLPAVSLSRGIYIAHPRWRQRDPTQRPDLKVFDTHVQAYLALQSNFDKITALAEIMSLTYHFIAGRGGNDRYSQAVTQLYNSALLDMNALCHPAHQQAMEHYITGVSRPARTVRVNLLLIKPSAVPAPPANGLVATAHIQTANAAQCFQDAQITVAPVGPIMQIHQNAHNQPFLLGPPAPVIVQGTFQDSAGGGDRLIDYCNTLPRNADVDVAYVDAFDQADIQGRTFRALQDYNGHVAQRPIIVIRLTPAVGGGATHGTTLLHELGHALCSESSHSADPANLMAGGANRTGADELSLGEAAWFCCNPYVQ